MLREVWQYADDETYVGGKRRNMKAAKRESLDGRGTKGKTPVVGMKDRDSNRVRAKVVGRTDAETLQAFVVEHAEASATVYTDEAKAYRSLPYDHGAVKHSVGEYVRGQAHTNGVESFWSTLKRAHKGTFHKSSPKHLNRYVQECAGKHNMRESGTLAQMRGTVARKHPYTRPPVSSAGQATHTPASRPQVSAAGQTRTAPPGLLSPPPNATYRRLQEASIRAIRPLRGGR